MWIQQSWITPLIMLCFTWITSMSRHNIVHEVLDHSSPAHIDWEHKLRWKNIVQVNETPILLVADVKKVLAAINRVSHDYLRFVVADSATEAHTTPKPLPQLALDQMRAIHPILHGWDLDDPFFMVSTFIDTAKLVTAKNADTMASGARHTHRTCLQGPHRDKLIEVEYAQLDKHHSYGMYGTTLARAQPPLQARLSPHLELFTEGLWNVKGHEIHEWQAVSTYWPYIRK
jgi:hypothetical protein